MGGGEGAERGSFQEVARRGRVRHGYLGDSWAKPDKNKLTIVKRVIDSWDTGVYCANAEGFLLTIHVMYEHKPYI